MNTRFKETAVKAVLLSFALAAVASVALITVFLVSSGLPAIGKIGLLEFIIGKRWASTAKDPGFGILPFILSSLYAATCSILIGSPIGLLCALYLSKAASKRTRAVISTLVDLLSGIPSVVFGLVGMMVLVPGIKQLFNLSDGSSLLSAIIVLSIMVLPTIVKVSTTALDAVPREYEDSSLALGASQVQTWLGVSIPAARNGIAASLVLGAGRAIGEAMAVMMVSGNAANMPSLFQSVRFLTTAVASEMSYSSGLQRQALFSIALVLYVFIMIMNMALSWLVKRSAS
ncbi:MAG: phosphate ABC transporter permease subunit PstC [Sphaerochaetaceae bacterium]|jgi:phosphate transport system permease protein|nr:phosphate ABC transporter permease subunit PstC [Sphaerochaetaceae bacterium]